MGRKRLLVGALLAVAAGCDAPTVPAENPAYEPRVYNAALDEMQLYHWPLGRTIRVYIDPAEGGTELAAHVRAGAEAWKDVVYYRELAVALVNDAHNADVIVHTQLAPYLVQFPEGCGTPSTIAGGVTFFCSEVGGERLTVLPLVVDGGGVVKMNMTIDPDDAPTPSEMRALITHELGHVFGIGGHSADPADVMFAGPTVTLPSARDASTLRYVLHQPADLHP